MAKMILVSGLSGSGKTTLAKFLANKYKYTYFCPDDFYALFNGDECIHENEFEVWIALYQAIHLAEKEGKNCIVDTDAITRTHRTEFLDWFPSFDHHLIYVEASKEQRRMNNMTRRRRVPNEELERMERRLEIPQWEEDPRWKSLIYIENINNTYYKKGVYKR